MLRLAFCAAFVAAIALASGGPAARAAVDDPLDPAHNAPLACEEVSTPGLLPRSAKNIAHLANVCGFVGTDVEFQSRTDASGAVRDYAFLGTMGAGLRIFEITDPAHPSLAGGYLDTGYQGDVQVRGDVAVVSFDAVGSTAPTVSACLQEKALATGTRTSGGVDIIRLSYDAATGNFSTSLIGCVALNPGGGAHNATLHPSGDWLAAANPRTQGSVDIIDLRGAPTFRYRLVQNASMTHAVCVPPAGAAWRCISNGRQGVWSPHDISFSRDGSTMYVAAVGNDTVLLDATNALAGSVPIVSIVPNDHNGDGVISATDGNDIEVSHQSDTTADGKILIVTDERGGGIDETSCNTTESGVVGGAHFWALAPIDGQPATAAASPANPVRLGAWFYPNPKLLVDPITFKVKRERACTIHVFRPGGNGTAGPGEIAAGYDGVSRLPITQVTFAHYGAGVWHLDISGRSSRTDGIAEDGRSSWGNTLGWNVMPGAETWSAKEYKGFIYAGDMGRGFDVYAFTSCEGAGCVILPTNTPGSASGGGQLDLAEMLVLRGTAPGGKVNFGMDVSYATGALAPTGTLTFKDRAAGKHVESTVIDSFRAAGNTASFTGRATVNGVPGISFFVEVEDLGEPGDADTFRIVLGDGYAAAGTVTKGNIQVRSSTAELLTISD